jgi:hypothetical protein
MVDMFPRTDKSCGLISKYGYNEKYTQDIKTNVSFHVETVVLMSRKMTINNGATKYEKAQETT